MKHRASGSLKSRVLPAEVKKPFVDTVWFPLLIIFANLAPWLAIGAVALAAFLKIYIREHRCPQCKKIGLVITRKWLLYPTYDYPGRQEVTKKCRYCSYYDKRTVSVSRLSRTYGSGSSSSKQLFRRLFFKQFVKPQQLKQLWRRFFRRRRLKRPLVEPVKLDWPKFSNLQTLFKGNNLFKGFLPL